MRKGSSSCCNRNVSASRTRKKKKKKKRNRQNNDSGANDHGSGDDQNALNTPNCEQTEVKQEVLSNELNCEDEKKMHRRINHDSASSEDRADHSDKDDSKQRLKQEAAQLQFKTELTLEEYGAAAKNTLFRHESLRATEANLEFLLRLIQSDTENGQLLNDHCFFMFSGSDEEIWDPIFNAKLAYEGFFTITTDKFGNKTLPLPELQPYYGFLLPQHFETSKATKKITKRLLRKDGCDCLLLCTSSPFPERSLELLNQYQIETNDKCWLTKQYFNMLKTASDDPTVNFTLHVVELYKVNDTGNPDFEHTIPLAGEIGISIGRVYTSLSGWVKHRSKESLGIIQLVLLGKWLFSNGFDMWSLGHCYLPQMMYKKDLGQRIITRHNFLRTLPLYRGEFRGDYRTSTTCKYHLASDLIAITL